MGKIKLIVGIILGAIIIGLLFYLFSTSAKTEVKVQEEESFGLDAILKYQEVTQVTPNGEYNILSQEGIDSFYNVKFEHIKDTKDIKIVYCLDDLRLAEAQKYEIITDESKGTIIKPYINYEIPTTIKVETTTLSAWQEKQIDVKSSINKDLINENCIEIIENPYLTKWIKLGENSTVIISGVNQSGSTLNNVAIENYPLSHIIMNDSSTILYYPFDFSSNTIYDYSQNNFDAVLGGGAWTATGVYGGGLSSLGVTNLMLISPSTSQANFVSTGFSVGLWVKYPAMAVTAVQSFVSKYTASNPNRVFDLRIHTTGVPRFFVSQTGNESTPPNSLGTTKINDSTWHFVVGTYNLTTINLYVDGAVQDTDVSVGTVAGANTNITIGYLGSSSNRLNATIDEVFILNRSLSAIEVASLYNNQSYRFKTPASQLFNLNFTAGDNRVNVTYNTTLLQGSSMQLRLQQFEGGTATTNTAWQTLTTGDNQLNIFNITSTTNNLTLEFNFSTDAYNFYSPILRDNIIVDSWTGGGEAPSDNEYPIFSNYWDDNASLVGSGIADFNVTLLNTNGTVFLQINNTNYTANNVTASVYNVSVNLTSNGTYSYYWGAWGNGTSHNFNISATRYYTVNAGAAPNSCTYSSGNWNVACSDNCSITSNVAISSGGNISLTGSGSFYLLANLTGWTQIYKDNACMLYKANGAIISK